MNPTEEPVNPPQPGTVVMPNTPPEAAEPTPPTVPVIPPSPVLDEPVPESELTPELDDTSEAPDPSPAAFSWQASEYVHHHKSAGWYALLVLVVVMLLAAAIITHQWLSIGVFAVMGAAIVVYARKPPRTLTYQLGDEGIHIDERLYPFSQFRAFAVLPDLAWHTIDLEPTQRFMPRLTILFETEDFDAIVGHLSEYLPRIDRQPDAVERLTRYLRF